MSQTNPNSDWYPFYVDTGKEPEPRNYRCRNYDTCLDRAALANKDFICRNCAQYEPWPLTEWQAILKKDSERLNYGIN